MSTERIDNEAFHGSLPEDVTRLSDHGEDAWVWKWNNLKHIYQSLEIYLADEIGLDFPLFERNPDLRAIAEHGGREDIIMLLKLCVVAAANCSNRIVFLQGMQHLNKPTQMVLMATLQSTQPSDMDSEEDREDQRSNVGDTVDTSIEKVGSEISKDSSNVTKTVSDLAFEERLAKVIADNQRIEGDKNDMQRQLDQTRARYKDLEDSYGQVREELERANERLDSLLSGKSESSDKTTNVGHEAVIAALEARVVETDLKLTELKKEAESFRLKADRAQKLQDDYDEIKIERDKLSRKANATEKYKLKLEATQDLEKEVVSLRARVTNLQSQVRQGDSSRAHSTDLQREIDEYRRILPNIEQERYELSEMKKKLEFDYHMLGTRYTDSEDQLRRSRQEVEELQGRLRDYDDGYASARSRSRSRETNIKDLETEEADFVAAEECLTRMLTRDDSWVPKVPPAETGGLQDDGVSEDELRVIMSAMRAQMHAGTAQERENGLKIQKKLIVMLEKTKGRNRELAQQIQKQAKIIAGLRSKTKIAELVNTEAKEVRAGKNMSELEQQLDAQDVLIDNLKREIKLICSAWYEQNQRLGTMGGAGRAGIVALMRSKASAGMAGDGLEVEEPRSFLGKQRRLVNSALMGTNHTRN